MRSIQGKRFGLIWNAWSDGTTVFRNESTKGLTWNAMVSAAESDPAVAARVKHFQYRVPLEFYDYQQDPDALDIESTTPRQRKPFRHMPCGLVSSCGPPAISALSDYEKLGLSP